MWAHERITLILRERRITMGRCRPMNIEAEIAKALVTP
jgi:hypothetical protein